jgi:hypothetical protein
MLILLILFIHSCLVVCFSSGWEAVFLDLILLIAVHCSVILLLLLLSLFLGGWRRNFVECVFYKLQIELLSIY